jgi:ectoine hydroxylase-related dioxygenase (phytanoyl-CoA dioxygenase family)
MAVSPDDFREDGNGDPVRTRLGEADVAAFQADGVLCLRGVFASWVDRVCEGVARNEREPSSYGGDSVASGEAGRFFDDYCNWRRIPEYRDFVLHSPAAAVAAGAMRSRTARIFHEHLLIKEPGTGKATPWHHDLPYYNVQGRQTASIWLALDPVDRRTCPEFVAGSHLWNALYYPRRFRDSANYDYQGGGFVSVPDIEASREDYDIRVYELRPGDAILFSFLTLHAAPANLATTRRRGFSTRWLGDDVTYAKRPGETSPPFNDIGLATGDPMPDDLFPIVWPAGRCDPARP